MNQRMSSCRILVTSDIDNTWVRKDRTLMDKTARLTEMVERANIPLILVTGIHFWARDGTSVSIEERIREGTIPTVDGFGSDVGTRMWWKNGNDRYIEDSHYQQTLVSERYDRRAIVNGLKKIITGEENLWGLEFQRPAEEEEFLAGMGTDEPYKVSGYFWAESGEEVEGLKNFVEGRFPGLEIVTAGELDYNETHPKETRKKYCLDILPMGGKLRTVKYLVEKMETDWLIMAGDSGNDLLMLLGDSGAKGQLSILAGGTDDVARVAVEEAARKGVANNGLWREDLGEGRAKWFYLEDGERKGPESVMEAIKRWARVLQKRGERELAERLGRDNKNLG